MSKSQKEEIDIIIVGAGIAGSVLGFYLANAGKKVKVFEKKKRSEIGKKYPLIVKKQILNDVRLPKSIISEKQKQMDKCTIFSLDKQTIIDLDYSNHYLFENKTFREKLIKIAERSGVIFSFDTEITDPVGRGQWVVGVKKKNGEIEKAQIVIDCSGNARILAKNIEVLDLNRRIKKNEQLKVKSETHQYDNKVFINEMMLEPENIYYLYGKRGEHTRIIVEDNQTINILGGVNPGISSRKPSAIINEYVNSSPNIKQEKTESHEDKILVRRTTSLVWYGFMTVGEAAAQVNPITGTGIESILLAAKNAAEVILDSLLRKEVSIQKLWEYQVNYCLQKGKDAAALDAMRRVLSSFTEDQLKEIFRLGLLSKTKFAKLFHGQISRFTLLNQIGGFFSSIKNLKFFYNWRKKVSLVNKIHKHYKKLPKEYDSRSYHKWLLEQLYFFEKLDKLCETQEENK